MTRFSFVEHNAEHPVRIASTRKIPDANPVEKSYANFCSNVEGVLITNGGMCALEMILTRIFFANYFCANSNCNKASANCLEYPMNSGF